MEHIASEPPTVWAGTRPLILASKSASRLKLLVAAGLAAEAVFPDVDERAVEKEYFNGGGTLKGLAMRLAEVKAVTVSLLRKGSYCLGADQTLIVSNRLLHKSRDLTEAAELLAALSGRTHCLRSAFCVAFNGEALFSESSTVRLRMRSLDTSEITRYLDLAGPAALSSVGCYQVEGLGVHLFNRVEGDHATILGLPLCKLLNWLRHQGLIVI